VIRADAKDIPRIFQVRDIGKALRCYRKTKKTVKKLENS
jgi:hypothetical protein